MKLFKKVMMALLCVAGMTGVSQAANFSVTNWIVAGNNGYKDTTYNYYHATNSLHMVSSNVYLLDHTIIFDSGTVVTIDPGTVVRGINERYTGDTLRPGALIIARGAKIYANGTAGQPVLFTDQWDDNIPWKGSTGTAQNISYTYINGGGATNIYNNTNFNYGAVNRLSGVWGGVVLCGKAFVNYDGYGNASSPQLGEARWPVEGTAVAAGILGGGNDDNDSSGSMTYCIIRYTGFQLLFTKELNGLTMYGVGRGTQINHIEVVNAQDDSFEWFGGCVNAKYLVTWGGGDDCFDSDAGYRGKNQFLFGVQYPMSGTTRESSQPDKGLEMDGMESVQGYKVPFALSGWYNMTVVGWDETDADHRNIAFVMRDNATPQIWNSIFMDFGAAGSVIESSSSKFPSLAGAGASYNCSWHFTNQNDLAHLPTSVTNDAFGNDVNSTYLYKNGSQQAGKQASVKDCIFWNTGNSIAHAGVYGVVPPGTAVTTTSSAGKFSDKNFKGPVIGDGSGSVIAGYVNFNILASQYNNVDFGNYGDSDGSMPIKARTRVATPASALKTSSVGYDVTMIDPRAANDALVCSNAVRADSFLSAANYRGAFNADNNWAKGWTTMDTWGLFGSATNPGVATQTFDMTTVVGFDSVAGVQYAVEGAPTVSGPWTLVGVATGTGGRMSVADIAAGQYSSTKFYRVSILAQ